MAEAKKPANKDPQLADATALVQGIESRIYSIRGQRVMLSHDLAELYGIETKVLHQAVRRNMERFPDDFQFLITQQEHAILRSQIVTSRWGGMCRVEATAGSPGGKVRRTVSVGIRCD